MTHADEKNTADQIKQLFQKRERECKVERRSLEIWLGVLRPIKWISVGSGIVLPTIAGFALLGDSRFLGEHWEIISGLLLLAAAILTGLHTGFQCDPHQAECARLIQQYKKLINGYQAAITVNDNLLPAKRDQLETRLSEVRENTSASPARWCIRRAEQAILAL